MAFVGDGFVSFYKVHLQHVSKDSEFHNFLFFVVNKSYFNPVDIHKQAMFLTYFIFF